MPWKRLIAITWLIILLCLTGFWIMSCRGTGSLTYHLPTTDRDLVIEIGRGDMALASFTVDSPFSLSGWEGSFIPYQDSPVDTPSAAEAIFGTFGSSMTSIGRYRVRCFSLPFWFLNFLQSALFVLLYLYFHRQEIRHRATLIAPEAPSE